MKRTLLLLCALGLARPLVAAEEAPVPAPAPAAAPAPGPVVKAPRDVDWHASGSLPPGAEYHLIYEDPKTHAVQLLVRMPKDYVVPDHRHSHDETIFVLKGRVVLGFGPRTETLAAGAYAVIPANTAFTMKAEGFGGAQFLASFNGPFDVKPR